MKKSNGKAADRCEGLYNKLFNWTNDPILILDRKTLSVLDCNRAAAKLYGYAEEEWRNVTLLDLHLPEDRARLKRRLETQAADQAEPFTHLSKEGRRLDIEMAVEEIEHHGQAAWVSIVRDRTGARQLEAELDKARAAAIESARLKSEFLTNVGHEIRTPLNGILGMTELTLSTDLSDEQREYLGMVKSAAQTMMSLMTDILDYTLMEAGKLHILEKNFHLRDSLDSMIRKLTARAGEKALTMTCEVAPDVLDELIGDPRRLCQALACLLDNAIKFTELGEVSLRVEAAGTGDHEVALRFSVSDTGIGIAPERQAMIFEAFTQVDGSATRKYNGTGLGLTICSRLIELMGGRIWVESEAGAGSTFHFTVAFALPSARRHQEFPAGCFAEALPAPVDAEKQLC